MTFVSRLSLGSLLLFGLACSRVSAPTTAELAPSRAGAESEPTQLGGSANSAHGGSAQPAALVELFTSEGCSSCPAADAVLAAMTEDAERRARRIFTLEFHVDYWNDLGWVDPFSAEEYSARQQMYARQLALDGLYTPQAVVNGRSQFVGSNAGALKGAVELALSSKARAQLALRAESTASEVRVRYGLSAAGPTELALALTQDHATTRVTRGENAERTLLHRHVVRAFATRELTGASEGEHTFAWPRALPKSGAVLVAFVSDRASHAVLTAEAFHVPTPAD